MRRRVSFWGALVLFLRNYLNFMDNSTRTEYWYMALWSLLYNIVIELLMFGRLAGILAGGARLSFSTVVSELGVPLIIVLVVTLATVIPTLALHVRRYRDAGISPLVLLLTLVAPVILCTVAAVSGKTWPLLVAVVLALVNLGLAALPSKGLHF